MATGIGLGILVLTLLLLGVRVWRSWQHTPTYFDAQYRTQTEDGWTLGMYRYTPKAQGQKARAVVVLCHELGSSPQLWEQGGTDSWPLQFKHKGYDVWSIGLRGTGQSRPQYLDAFHGWGWDIETHLDLDVPALFATIRLQTNNLPIHWIGHGLGGALGLLAQATHKLPLASIAVMGVGLQPLRRFGLLQWLIQRWPRPVFPLRWLYRLLSPPIVLWRYIGQLFRRSMFRQPCTSSLKMMTGLISQLTPTSTPSLQQWMQWLAQGQWLSSTTEHRLDTNLSEATCPILCLSIPGDRFAPEASVKRLFQQLPESQRTLSTTKNPDREESPNPPSPQREKDPSLHQPSPPNDRGHFSPLFSPLLRKALIHQIGEWHQEVAPFPKEKKLKKRKKRTPSINQPAKE